jgi:hypothetical protein
MIELLILAGALQCPPSPWLTPELEKYSVPGFGCDSRMYNVIDNVIYAAEEYYWTPIRMGEDPKVCWDRMQDPTVRWDVHPNGCTRAPCGGEANCAEPYLADTATCWVEQTDCWEYLDSMPEGTPYQEPIILRTFVLECSGTINCKWPLPTPMDIADRLPADFCCELLEVIEEPTPGNNSC